MDVAFAMAALTFSWSSLDINRPALRLLAAALGSSIVSVVFVECVDTVVEMVVARAVGRPSAVTNNCFACVRSY